MTKFLGTFAGGGPNTINQPGGGGGGGGRNPGLNTGNQPPSLWQRIKNAAGGAVRGGIAGARQGWRAGTRGR